MHHFPEEYRRSLGGNTYVCTVLHKTCSGQTGLGALTTGGVHPSVSPCACKMYNVLLYSEQVRLGSGLWSPDSDEDTDTEQRRFFATPEL